MNAWKTVGKGQELAYTEDGKLAGNVEDMRDGNILDGQTLQKGLQQTANFFNPEDGQQVRITEGATNTEGRAVYGAAHENSNMMFVDIEGNRLNSLVNTVAHEGMHLKGAGETNATATGYLTDLTYRVNAWANSGQISEHRVNPQQTPVGIFDPTVHQALLAGNNELYRALDDRGELDHRQLSPDERQWAQDIANAGPYGVIEIENALRAMSNQELGELPGSNIVVNENNPELAEQNNGVAAERFDEGGTWIQTGDGIQVQLIPKDIDPALASFIISQTGGEDSPYSLPVYTPTGGVMTYQRDPITGARVVDENGQYTVVHVVEGQYFNIKHWPCDTEKGCSGSIPDPKSPNYDAWVTAQNIKAAKDAATVGGGAAGLMRAKITAEAVSHGSTVLDLYADYMSGDFVSGMSAESVRIGFESALKKSGVPDGVIQKVSATIGVSGGYDKFIDLYTDQLGDK